MSLSCPEELLEKELAGALAEAELRELDAHRAGCVVCAAELALRLDTPVAPGDAARIETAIDGALARRVAAPLRAARSTTARRLRWVLPAAAALLIALAAAASARRDLAPLRRSEASEALRGVAERVANDARATPPTAPPSDVAAPPGAAPAAALTASVAPIGKSGGAPPTTANAPATSAAATPGESAETSETSAELYARANAARRAGDSTRALALYGELAQRYPSSREALTAEVARGRILLDQRGDPTGALAAFDSYLRRAPGGTLAEEALASRALCEERLGRSAAAKASWRALLQRYPDGAQAARARERLRED